jgi:hypothetical protein
LSKNYNNEELINMNVNTFSSQLGDRSYRDYIEYLVKKYKKVQLGELASYFLDKLSDEHDLCRQSIGHEIESIGFDFWQSSAIDFFGQINNRLSTWDEKCLESQIIDMYQSISFLYAANCYLSKNFRRALSIKVGFFS